MIKNIPDYRFLAEDICWSAPRINEKDFSVKKEIYSIIKKKPQISVPLIIVGTVFVGINIFNSILISKINEIKPLNQEYKRLVKEIDGLRKANETIRMNTVDVRNLIYESINPVEFAANLQNIVPLTVQIRNYEIVGSKMFLEAMSKSQKDLDEFIVLLGTHPMIDEESILIVELNASGNELGGNTIISSLLNSQYSISITADTKILSNAEVIDLIMQSGNYGLHHKLNILTKGQSK